MPLFASTCFQMTRWPVSGRAKISARPRFSHCPPVDAATDLSRAWRWASTKICRDRTFNIRAYQARDRPHAPAQNRRDLPPGDCDVFGAPRFSPYRRCVLPRPISDADEAPFHAPYQAQTTFSGRLRPDCFSRKMVTRAISAGVIPLMRPA